MEIKYIEHELSDHQKEGVKRILFACDKEFFPPLSERSSTTQKDLRREKILHVSSNSGPQVYYDEMIKQSFILATDNDNLLAFMSFKRNYECDALKDFGTSLYISTVCVEEAHRRKGILNDLYDCIENELTQKLNCNKVSTRTWSTNEAQIKSLLKRKYKKVTILKNDRGEGIDTIYYGIKI